MSNKAWMMNGFPVLMDSGKGMLADECCCGCSTVEKTFLQSYLLARHYHGSTVPYTESASGSYTSTKTMIVALEQTALDDQVRVLVNGLEVGVWGYGTTPLPAIFQVYVGDVVTAEIISTIPSYIEADLKLYDVTCAAKHWRAVVVCPDDPQDGDPYWGDPELVEYLGEWAGPFNTWEYSTIYLGGVNYYAKADYYTFDFNTPENPTGEFYWVRKYYWIGYDCTTSTWSSMTSEPHGCYSAVTDIWVGLRDWIYAYESYYQYLTDNTVPESPTFTPACRWYWIASWDCTSSSWQVTLSNTNTSGVEVTNWSDGSSGYSERITSTATTPEPPEEELTCVFYWEAYYDCGTLTWTVYGYGGWVGSGSDTPWAVSGTYASCTTTTASQPSPPTETPEC